MLDIKNKKSAYYTLSVLILFNILAWISVYELSQNRFLEVNFFDVGQGDAIFIQTPEGHQVLIDGGPDSTVLGKLAKEMPFWDRSIDLIVLTHPERDHITGLLEVLKRYKIESILWTGVIRDTGEYKEWLTAIEKEGAEIKIAKAGQEIIFSSSERNPGYLKILYPFDNLAGQKLEKTNNTSIVSRLLFENNSFLFTGDISKSVEKKLIAKDVNSDILKVAHHGSRTSSFEDFIFSILPKTAVIQVGRDNKYGHPHNEVLATLDKFDINIWRTDKNGDIKIISDGINFKIVR